MSSFNLPQKPLCSPLPGISAHTPYDVRANQRDNIRKETEEYLCHLTIDNNVFIEENLI